MYLYDALKPDDNGCYVSKKKILKVGNTFFMKINKIMQ